MKIKTIELEATAEELRNCRQLADVLTDSIKNLFFPPETNDEEGEAKWSE